MKCPYSPCALPSSFSFSSFFLETQQNLILPLLSVPGTDLSLLCFKWDASLKLMCIHSPISFSCYTLCFFPSLCSQHERPQITAADSSPICAPLVFREVAMIYLCGSAGATRTWGWASEPVINNSPALPSSDAALTHPRKHPQTPNSTHIQASADTGSRRHNECFPPRSRLELKPTPHPSTFYSHSWNYLVCLLYPQPSVMGWAGRDKLSNQKIEGSISGCDNLIRQLICINICTAWWCRWAFAYFLFLDVSWQAGGECRAFWGVRGN